MNKKAVTPFPFFYDEVPYDSHSYRVTHPDHLYVIGRLFGMTPPPFETARVLELGCAAGGNLVPLALAFPKMDLLGIDLSVEEIAAAERRRRALRLGNVRFAQRDIMDLNKNDGPFDYIICHGVFSWVPDAVREKILALCREALSPQGLALISYNALPGWHFAGGLREMMRYHAGLSEKPEDKTKQARLLLDFLHQAAVTAPPYYRDLIEQERNLLAQVNDSYIFHDHLSGLNRPFYLHEFADALKPHKLQYVGDTNVGLMYAKNAGEAAAPILAKIGDPVRQEQYIDFLSCRRFRMSLITHDDITLNRTVNPGVIHDMALTAAVTPETTAPDISKPVIFKRREGTGHFVSSDPVLSDFMMEMVATGQKPTAFRHLALHAGARHNIPDVNTLMAALAAPLTELAFGGFVNLHAQPGIFVSSVSGKPRVYELARHEAADNPHTRHLTAATREMVATEPFTNHLAALADGTRTMTDLIAAMEPHEQDAARREALVRQALDKFAQAGLLVE